jgi:hypothetical protein
MNFHAQLADQLDFIQASCERYDQGKVREGVRIATALRVLFHQTKSSTSLLTHLSATNIALLSTCDLAKPRQRFFPGMTKIQLDPANKRMEWVPKLHVDYERPVTFNTWWCREVVYLSKPDSLQITRKDLVLGAANKDGGSHVDRALEPRYEKVLEGLGWSMTVNPDNEPSEEVQCKHGHLAALRQMGYEVLHSPRILALA